MQLQAQWEPQNSGTFQNLNDVYCITENTVVVVGDNGTILKTTDGGTNWISKPSGTTNNLSKVQFPSPNVGYAIKRWSGILLKTIDGGESWNTINSGLTNINDISCISESVFYISDDNGLKKTTNGGATFDIVNANTYGPIQFINEQIGYAGGTYKTTDGGITWQSINSFSVTSFFFRNENIGFIETINGDIYKTIDGGFSFIFLGINPEPDNIYNKIFASTEKIIWIVPGECLLNGSNCYAMRGEILSNGTFQNEAISITSFRSIHFASPTKGFAVLSYGGIYKNSTGNLGFVEVKKNEFVSIYPNPVKEQLTVSFKEAPTNAFEIVITDILGKKVFSKRYSPVNAIITLATLDFSKGVYFLSVNSQDKKQTQKFIIN